MNLLSNVVKFIPAKGKSNMKMMYLEIPKYCPICHKPTKIIKDNESEVLYCGNPACEGKLLNRVEHFFSKKGLFGLIAVAGLALLPLAIQKISEIKSKGGLFSWLLDKAGTFITNTVPKIVSGVGTAISKGLDWFINNKDKIGNFIKDTLADFSEWFSTNALP